MWASVEHEFKVHYGYRNSALIDGSWFVHALLWQHFTMGTLKKCTIWGTSGIWTRPWAFSSEAVGFKQATLLLTDYLFLWTSFNLGADVPLCGGCCKVFSFWSSRPFIPGKRETQYPISVSSCMHPWPTPDFNSLTEKGLTNLNNVWQYCCYIDYITWWKINTIVLLLSYSREQLLHTK